MDMKVLCRENKEDLKDGSELEEDARNKENFTVTSTELKKRISLEKTLQLAQKRTKFSERCKTLTPTEVCKELTQEMNAVSGNILQLWYKYTELIKNSPKKLLKALHEEYERMLNETFGYFMFPSEVDKGTIYVNYADRHKFQAEALRSGHFFNTLQALPVRKVCDQI